MKTLSYIPGPRGLFAAAMAVLALWPGLMAASAAGSAGVAGVTLVRSGHPRAAIYVSPVVMAPDNGASPPAQQEAEQNRRRLRESVRDLAFYLKTISGAEIPIRTGSASRHPGSVPILIGSIATAAFGPPSVHAPAGQGWRMIVSTQGVGLEGDSDLGTSYAIYELLHRVGCRWYMPGPLGECIPSASTITLPMMDRSSAPSTDYRGIWYADDAFRRRNRLGGLNLSTGQVLETYITAEQRALHPEWRAIIHGKPDPVRLKWSNREAGEAVADAILKQLAANPAPSASLSPEDGFDFDESAEDRALDAGDFDRSMNAPALTDRLMVLCNRVARRVRERYPDELLGVLAYVQFTRPPVRVKPGPGVIPEIAPINLNRTHPMTDPDTPEGSELLNDVIGWSKVSPTLGYYAYGYNLAEVSAPYPLITQWSQDIPVILAHHCKYWQPETLPNFETSLPGLYLGIRLSWDAAEKPDRIISSWLSRFYGRAAAPMREYWMTMDRAWGTPHDDIGCGFGYAERFTPAVMARARSVIEQAKLAGGTPLERRRIQLADESLGLFERFMALRRSLFEGRFQGLDARAAEWDALAARLGKTYQGDYCFTSAGWAMPETVAGRYFRSFFQPAYDDAARLARDFRILTPAPLRSWRYHSDPGDKGAPSGWSSAEFDDSHWSVTDPCTQCWSTLGLHNYFGPFWYRESVWLSDPVPGKKVYLWLSSTDGSARVYVNGHPVPYLGEGGKVSGEFSGYCQPASFDITSAIRAGSNSITIRCRRETLNEIGTGGLLGPVVVYSEK